MPFDTLLKTTGEAVLVVDSDCRVTRISKAFETVTGIPPLSLLDHPLARLGEMAGMTSLMRLVREVFSSAGVRRETITLPGRTGPLEMVIQPVPDNGRVSGCIVILHPSAAGHSECFEGLDELTGLPNRHLFADRIEQAINNAQRGNKSVLIMLVGIDRFREISDALGGDDGSQILLGAAARLRQCARTSDTMARLDEDRFGFVMQIAAIDDSVLLTEKVLSAFEPPFSLDSRKDVVITCSLGASIYPADGVTAAELIKNATVALHHAEHETRSCCQFFSSEMNARARHRLEIESGIRRALSKRELLVYYQPKIDINTRCVAGMEALVRWHDPERGLVPPGEFIPVAEESGLIEQIGQWVLEEACTQNNRWQAEGLMPVRTSVNVSARQFHNRNFVSMVEDVLERSGLDPRWLELEITESVLMGNIAVIVERMEYLRRIGVSLSIDDFGTGYSSLSYLSRFPISTLKIDRAFIADVQVNPQTAEIVRAIIGLSRGLNLEVVAEGAEVNDQIEFLRAHGCDLVQGFFYSKPLPAEEFAVMLRDGLVSLTSSRFC